MKKHLVGLAFLSLALGAQACQLSVDLPRTLLSPGITPATSLPIPSSTPAAGCADELKSNDSDGDGALNISEFNSIVNPPYVGCPTCGARVNVDPSVALNKYDKNGDGKLQQAEFCAYLAGSPVAATPTPAPTPTPGVAFTPTPAPTSTPTVQTTPTPAVSTAPTPTPLPGKYTATPAAFDLLDTDKDGKVSWDEEVAYQTKGGALPAGAKDKIYDLFRQADTNQNGSLERSEYDFARN
ncbi:MAG: hypothetical protein JWM80_1461 [Cyanobacteria bacterium RYN_339]|nr:hypothetical protein [Cyanobacteria bacterium RYN_339]